MEEGSGTSGPEQGSAPPAVESSDSPAPAPSSTTSVMGERKSADERKAAIARTGVE